MEYLSKRFTDKCTTRVRRVLSFLFKSNRKRVVRPIDFLYTLSKQKGSLAANILSAHKIKVETIKRVKEKSTRDKKSEEKMSSDLKDVFKKTLVLASNYENNYLGTEHFLGALTAGGVFKEIIKQKEKREEVESSIKEQVETLLSANRDLSLVNKENFKFSLGEDAGREPTKKSLKSSNPLQLDEKITENFGETLESFSQDLTEKADRGLLDPLIGREKEIERLINILSRRNKNNPVLVGEAGVGKTAIVNGLAQKMVRGDVPEHLLGRRLLYLDLGLLIAGTVFRGEFEERLRGVIEEAQDEEAILFIDEIHTIVGTGSTQGSLDLANMLKPAISQGDLQVVGATTTDEYRRYIEKDPALERRFQPIKVNEPTLKETEEILKGLKEDFENYHQIKISNEVINKTVFLSNRFIKNRFFPDKAIDVLDEASARLRSQKKLTNRQQKIMKLEESLRNIAQEKEEAIKKELYTKALQLKVEEESLQKELISIKKQGGKIKRKELPSLRINDINEVVSVMSGVSVEKLTKTEKEKLLKLENLIKERIIGQDEAVKLVSSALRRGRSGIKEESRPIGSFLFLGSSGVGKTELAKVIANVFFEDPGSFIKLDMSEFSEPHTVSKMLGAPAGYIGYDESKSFCEMVRQKPYSLILFDEIEKAHPRVHDLLLQILEDGELTDAQGKKANFKNSLIVLTSNIGTNKFWAKKAPGFIKEKKTSAKKEVHQEVYHHLKPELVSRLDHSIIFKPLSKKDIESIVQMELDKLKKRVEEQGFKFTFTKTAVEYLANRSKSKKSGARKVRSIVQKKIEDQLAKKIIENPQERKISVKVNKSGLVWKSLKK